MDYGRIAYEACPDQPHKRVTWEQLAPHWREYWTTIANAVRRAACPS